MSAPFPALCLFGLVLLASGNTAACEWDSHKVEVNSTEIHFDTCNSYFSRTKLWDYRVLAERLDSSLPHSVSGTAKLVWQMEREGSASERGAKIVSKGNVITVFWNAQERLENRAPGLLGKVIAGEERALTERQLEDLPEGQWPPVQFRERNDLATPVSWLMSVSGANNARYSVTGTDGKTSELPRLSGQVATAPVWSPDGRYFAYGSLEELVVVDLGTRHHKIFKRPTGAASPLELLIGFDSEGALTWAWDESSFMQYRVHRTRPPFDTEVVGEAIEDGADPLWPKCLPHPSCSLSSVKWYRTYEPESE